MIDRIPFANYHVFTYTLRSVATNSGLRGGVGGGEEWGEEGRQVPSGPFYIVRTELV